MAVDASIYSQIRQPEPVNLLAVAGQAQQLQGMQQQNRLAELAFQDRERAQADSAAMRQAVQGFGNDTAANYNRLLQTGNLGAAQNYQKGIIDNAKVQAEARAKEIETASKRVDLAGQVFGFVRANPSLENAVSAINHLQQNGIWTPEQAQQYLSTVQANPQAIPQLAEQAFRAALDAKEQLAKIQTNNVGGQTLTQSFDPVTGQVRQLSTIQNTESPDAQLQSRTSITNANTAASAQREIASATRDAAKINRQGSNETELRKEFANLPEVKNLKEAIPAYQAVVKAAKVNNPQADINLVYGLAKLYDPTSVVREGEYNTIANSQAIPEIIKGYAQRLAGGGRLTEDTKRQIIEQANSRIEAYKSEVEGARRGYNDIARRGGLTPENVFVPVGEQLQPIAPPAAPAPKPARGEGKFRILGVEG